MKERLQKLSESLPAGIDAALITSPVSRRYLLGFPSSAGTLIVTKAGGRFIVDSRYFEAAQSKIHFCEVVLQDELYTQIADILKKQKAKTAAVENDFVTLSEFARMSDKLPGFVLMTQSPVSGLIEKQRMIKSPDELACMRKAQEIADKTFEHILGFIRPGVTELAIAAEMEQCSRRLGSEAPAFEYIVAAGTNSSMPHAVPGDYAIKAGDFITIDFGCTVNGYRSDMTRTVAVGKIGEKQKHVYELVLRAQEAPLFAIRPGAACREIDRIARDMIDASEFAGLFGHGLGHSLGLEVHERPSFSRDCETVLEPGMVMSVEPGVYIPGEFGVRIEDCVAVTDNGCENLCRASKELIIL